MDRADTLINTDRPVVQESTRENHVELVLPSEGVTVEMHHDEFLEVFGDGMRIITGVDANGDER